MTEYRVTQLTGTESAKLRTRYAESPDTHPEVLEIIAQHDVDPMVAKGVLKNPLASDEVKQIVLDRFQDIYNFLENGCPLLWNHISTFSNGDVRMCCEMIGKEANYGKSYTDDDQVVSVHTHSLEQARNSKTVKHLRKLMLDGHRPIECQQCFHRESLGMESKRTGSLLQYNGEMAWYAKETSEDGTINTDQIPLRNLDLRFGNTCNLKCRSCGPQDSNLWYNDYLELNSEGQDTMPMWFYGNKKYKLEKGDRSAFINSKDFEWQDRSRFYSDLLKNLHNTTTIYFTGGEPTVIKKHKQMLEYCIEKDLAKNIYLEYNTNLHATPTYLSEYWTEFQQVNIGASIDGYGSVQGYMRPPSSWDSVKNNLLKLNNLNQENLKIRISPTFSIMNILNLPKLADWLLAQQLNNINPMLGNHTLYYPEEYSVQVLPSEVKRYVLAYYESWFLTVPESFELEFRPVLDYMMQDDKSDKLKNFFDKTKKLDEIRGESFSQGLPELYGVLKSYGHV